MKRCSTADLRRLEIVNLCDGARLGYACDFEMDCEDARILALVIPGSGGIFGWGREDDLVIPWHMIECIGQDAILVRLTKQDVSCCRVRRGATCGGHLRWGGGNVPHR